MRNFSVSFNITGISEMGQAMGLRGQAVEQAKNAAVDRIVQKLQETARMFAEGGHPSNPEVHSGELQQDIQWSHVGDGVAKFFTTLDYSYWVEFGHSQEPGRYVPDIQARLVQSFVPAYPFFRPALTQVMDSGEAEQIIIDTLEAAVQRGNGGGGSSGSGASKVIANDVSTVAEL